MFQLAIQHRATETVTAHPSRELALTELLKFLADTGCDYRVTQATWRHSSYQIFDPTRSGDREQAPIATGRAVIAEICRCEHTHHQHDDTGSCTEKPFTGTHFIDCGCTEYEPAAGDPTLFDTDLLAPTPAHPDQPLAESA